MTCHTNRIFICGGNGHGLTAYANTVNSKNREILWQAFRWKWDTRDGRKENIYGPFDSNTMYSTLVWINHCKKVSQVAL